MVRRERVFPDWLVGVPHSHRGCFSNANGIPENSLAAFQRAVDQGFGIECDLKLSAEGEVVVFHDDTLDRMCGVPGRVGRTTLEKLRSLRLRNTDERIPLLSELLDLVAGRVPLLIELKSFEDDRGFPNDFDLEDAALQQLRSYVGPLAVQSFNPRTVRYLLERVPAWPVGLIACDYAACPNEFRFLPWWQRHFFANLGHAWVLQPDYVVYDFSALPKQSVALARRRFPIVAWGVNDEATLARSHELVDNIIFENLSKDQLSTRR